MHCRKIDMNHNAIYRVPTTEFGGATERHSHVQEVRLTAGKMRWGPTKPGERLVPEIARSAAKRSAGAGASGSAAPLMRTDADGPAWTGEVFVSDEDGRSPELRRGRSGAGTEADAAGAEDPRRRGGSQGHRPVRGRQGYANWPLRLLAGKVVELGDKPRNGEADAKKRLLLQKESPVPGESARKRSSWRGKCLK